MIDRICLNLTQMSWAVFVAQMVERSLPTPEIRSSNPVISIILSSNCLIEKMKIKKKRPGMAHLKKPHANDNQAFKQTIYCQNYILQADLIQASGS